MKPLRSLLPALLALFALAGLAGCRHHTSGAALIPAVEKALYTSDRYTLESPLRVFFDNEAWAPAVGYLGESFAPALEVTASDRASATLRLLCRPELSAPDAYHLSVSRSGITVEAATYGGVAAAVATLRQLADAHTLPYCRIEDHAKFAWRGFMLDVSRHFFSPGEVKRLIDYAARYKFNKFHWHLTDDQGWRIAIDAYPELTARGAWRDPATHNHDIECLRRAVETSDSTYLLPASKLRTEEGRTRYGGFYTKAEIRDIVTYAAVRGIDVIPELDMPGHSQRAIDAYPSLACFGKASWGETFSAPLCLGRDATLDFCRNVYREVFELFPYEYVHIGGDEVEKTDWKKCPACQARIREEGLADEKELQSWFIREMTDFFARNGRKLIGWDEIEEGGLEDGQTVMWWRGWTQASFRNAIARGNDVIISCGEYLYLDNSQSRNSLAKVYGFDPEALFEGPVPSTVKGLQCHLWCEQVPSYEKACYRLFPRMLAVSEVAWGKRHDDFADFEQRVRTHLQSRFDADGTNYRMPDPGGFCDRNIFLGDSTRVVLTLPVPDAEIRYTLDGSVPDRSSARYDGGILLTGDTRLRLRSYTPAGCPGEVMQADYLRSDYLPAVETTAALADGLRATWYDYTGEACGEIETAAPKGDFTVPTIAIPDGVSGNIGLVFNGYIEVPADGIYTFSLHSDDGSLLRIDGETVIDNDGPHSRIERSGQVALRKGLHRLEARYFDHNGGILEFGAIDASDARTPLPDGIRFRTENR